MKIFGMTLPEKSFVTGLTALRQFVRFVATMPKTYMGTAAYQVRATDARSHGSVTNGWMIAERGSAVALEIFAKKSDAVREAKRLAREHRAHLDVFSRAGALQTHMSFA